MARDKFLRAEYEGHANKHLKVKNSEDGLEYADLEDEVNATASGSGFRDIHLIFGGHNEPAKDIKSDTWKLVGTFIFRGTNVLGIPLKYQVVASVELGSSPGDIRLYDMTNNNTVGEINNINAEFSTIYTAENLQNLPTNEAVFEIQAKGEVSKKVYIFSFSLQF